MTKANTEHARDPMREMKNPNPGTNMATSATNVTIPIRMTRYTPHRLGAATLDRNQCCNSQR